MATQTPRQLVEYYSSLLIIQYLNLPHAAGMIESFAGAAIIPQTSVQDIVFSGIAASGNFSLSYNGIVTSINWADSAGSVQTKLRGISGLESVTVNGSIASQLLTVTFTGVIPPSLYLLSTFNSLEDGSSSEVEINIVETDETIPLAVQDAFNVTGPRPAQGVQLDVIGKYAGVTRSGYAPLAGQITLDDADFLSFIQFAIVKNSAGSSMYDIVTLLNQFFPGQILVFDHLNMTMTYVISGEIGSLNLVLLMIAQGLLPVPMAVGLAVVYVPIAPNVFGFSTYEEEANNSTPFNTYENYNLTWHWLDYSDVILYL